MTYPYMKDFKNSTTTLKANFLCQVKEQYCVYKLSHHVQLPRGKNPRLTFGTQQLEQILCFTLKNETYMQRIEHAMTSSNGKVKLAIVYFDMNKQYKVELLCGFERRRENTTVITLITIIDKPPVNNAMQPVLFLGVDRIELDAEALHSYLYGEPKQIYTYTPKTTPKITQSHPMISSGKEILVQTLSTSQKKGVWYQVVEGFRIIRHKICNVMCG